MSALFDLIERASGLFVREQYARGDPAASRGSWRRTLTTWTPRCASRRPTPRSDTRRSALEMFDRAARIAPGSQDVRTYLALHYARGKAVAAGVPLLEQVLAEAPDRLPALEALAVVRERQGRIADAVALRAARLRDAARPRRPSSSSWGSCR